MKPFLSRRLNRVHCNKTKPDGRVLYQTGNERQILRIHLNNPATKVHRGLEAEF